MKAPKFDVDHVLKLGYQGTRYIYVYVYMYHMLIQYLKLRLIKLDERVNLSYRQPDLLFFKFSNIHEKENRSFILQIC